MVEVLKLLVTPISDVELKGAAAVDLYQIVHLF
jgi:hypothetical protein